MIFFFFLFLVFSNDDASNIHPGYMDDTSGSVDNNCNGIYGTNTITGNTYEYDYCEGSKSLSSRRSIVIFGDSAAAAFRIPVEVNNI